MHGAMSVIRNGNDDGDWPGQNPNCCITSLGVIPAGAVSSMVCLSALVRFVDKSLIYYTHTGIAENQMKQHNILKLEHDTITDHRTTAVN